MTQHTPLYQQEITLLLNEQLNGGDVSDVTRRLIAKAPEMLALLQSLNREGGVFEDWAEENVGGVDEDFDAVNNARALLREIKEGG